MVCRIPARYNVWLGGSVTQQEAVVDVEGLLQVVRFNAFAGDNYIVSPTPLHYFIQRGLGRGRFGLPFVGRTLLPRAEQTNAGRTVILLQVYHNFDG